MFQYNSQGCTKPLISVGETVGSIRRQLICIGESKLYCLNKKICRFFSADKKENSLAHSRKIIVRKFEKKQTKTDHTNTHHTHKRTQTHTHTHTKSQKYKPNTKNTNFLATDIYSSFVTFNSDFFFAFHLTRFGLVRAIISGLIIIVALIFEIKFSSYSENFVNV